MKKRFSEEQIVKILQEHKEGKTISEVCRNYGIAENINCAVLSTQKSYRFKV